MKKINNGKCGRCYRATRTLMLGLASWEYYHTDILEKFGCLLSIFDPGILVLDIYQRGMKIHVHKILYVHSRFIHNSQKNIEVPINRRMEEQWCIYMVDTNYTNGFSKKGPTSILMNLKNTTLIKEIGHKKST